MDALLGLVKFELRNKNDDFLFNSHCHRVLIPPGRFVAQKRENGHFYEVLNVRAYRITYDIDIGFIVWTLTENRLYRQINIENN